MKDFLFKRLKEVQSSDMATVMSLIASFGLGFSCTLFSIMMWDTVIFPLIGIITLIVIFFHEPIFALFYKPKAVGNENIMCILWGIGQDLITGFESQLGIPNIYVLPCSGEWYNSGKTVIYRYRILKNANQQQNTPTTCDQFRKIFNQRRYIVYQQKAYSPPFTQPNAFYILSLKDNGNEYVMDAIPVSDDNSNSVNIAKQQYSVDNSPQGFYVNPNQTPPIPPQANATPAPMNASLLQGVIEDEDFYDNE
jgi:hypothetical protein